MNGVFSQYSSSEIKDTYRQLFVELHNYADTIIITWEVILMQNKNKYINHKNKSVIAML